MDLISEWIILLSIFFIACQVGFSDPQSDSPEKVKIILGVGIRNMKWKTITKMCNILL